MSDSVLKAINLLQDTQSILEKKEILKDYDDFDLKQVLKLTYDPFIKFYLRGDNANLVNKIKNKRHFNDELDMKQLYSALNKLSTRKVTGYEAIETIFKVIETVSHDECVLVQNILNKDLRAGISTKIINSIYPKLTKEYDVMLCDSLNEAKTKRIDMKKLNALKYPVLADLKQDGVRGTFNFLPDIITSRSGLEIAGYDNIVKLLKEFNADNPNRILEGELKGGTLNETMTQLNRIKNKDTSNFIFVLFDKLEDINDNRTCFQRLKELRELVEKFNSPYIQMNTSKVCNTPQDILDHLYEVDAKKEEGLVIKTDSIYEFKRSKNWLKLKLFLSDEMRIIDLQEGTGRNKDRLGAFVVDYNGVKVNVGSGLSDDQREEYWEEKDSLIGKLIEVSYKQITPDGSLQFPSFVKIRWDLE